MFSWRSLPLRIARPFARVCHSSASSITFVQGLEPLCNGRGYPAAFSAVNSELLAGYIAEGVLLWNTQLRITFHISLAHKVLAVSSFVVCPSNNFLDLQSCFGNTHSQGWAIVSASVLKATCCSSLWLVLAFRPMSKENDFVWQWSQKAFSMWDSQLWFVVAQFWSLHPQAW